MWIAIWVMMVLTATLIIRKGGRRLAGVVMYWVTRGHPPEAGQVWIDGNKSIFIRDVKDGRVFAATYFGRSQIAWSEALVDWRKFVKTNRLWKSPKL